MLRVTRTRQNARFRIGEFNQPKFEQAIEPEDGRGVPDSTTPFDTWDLSIRGFPWGPGTNYPPHPPPHTEELLYMLSSFILLGGHTGTAFKLREKFHS